MDLTKFDFHRLSLEKKIDKLHIAREYVQLEVLRMLAASELKTIICFKGGTALHLLFNLDRYSEDLDFSLAVAATPQTVKDILDSVLKNEEVTDAKVKRKTLVYEIRQLFSPQNFRLKIEINTDNIVPAELRSLYSPYSLKTFTLQCMTLEYIVAQKIRALSTRYKGRDLYDFWFIMRTGMPVNASVLSEILEMKKKDIFSLLLERIEAFTEKKLRDDLNPFVTPSKREWIKSSLKNEALILARTLGSLNGTPYT